MCLPLLNLRPVNLARVEISGNKNCRMVESKIFYKLHHTKHGTDAMADAMGAALVGRW
jgi:hypothetical protein